MSILKYENVKAVEKRMEELGMDLASIKKESYFALDIWNNPKSSYLRKADQSTLLKAIVNIASVGLTLNPVSKECYLIPRSVNGAVECHLEPSYIGLVKLITDTGLVSNIQTNLVYEGDLFDIDLMTGKQSHKPYYSIGKEKGSIVGVYSIAFLTNGNTQYEFMDYKEVCAIKEKSESYKAFSTGRAKSSIWNDFESEMIRKTVLKRLTKYLPRSGKSNYIDNALDLTNQDFQATNSQIGLIESLLSKASITEIQKEQIERDLFSLNANDAATTINFLKENQLMPIESGNNYSQSDIHTQLDNKMNDPKA